MKDTIHFRKATKEDTKFLLELRKASMTDHLEKAGITLSDEQHMDRINEFYGDSYILHTVGYLIGLIKFSIRGDRIHIRQFQIMPSFHGKGIGSNVLRTLKQKAAERKLPITLNVLLNNPAKRLYLRHGFIVENQNKLEYQMRWLPENT